MKKMGIENTEARTKLYLENIKCGGCATTITGALKEQGLSNIEVIPETSTVEFDKVNEEAILQAALSKLKSLGYPLVDSEEGLEALLLKGKSYLSCAIGKMS